MADIVNLRRARKAKAKSERSAEADANRIKFGRTKAERALTDARNHQARGRLEGHKVEDEPREG